MKKIPLILTLTATLIIFMIGQCKAGPKKDWTPVKCRITYYHPHQDKWGDQVACPNTKKAKEGVTVAAHPKFKFGKKIYIPDLDGKVGDGFFKVQDRGPAVTKKKASKGKAFVFDIFIRTKSKYLKMVKNKEYMIVYIE